MLPARQRRAGKQKTHRRIRRWVVNFYSLTVQPPIAKAQATPALRSHVACIGVELTLAMKECIDYRRTLNHSRRRSIDYLLCGRILPVVRGDLIGEK
jgi:hypothetical protein